MGLAFEKGAFDNTVNTSFVFLSPLGIPNSFQRESYILIARIKGSLGTASSRKSQALTQPQKTLKNILETDILVRNNLRAVHKKRKT